MLLANDLVINEDSCNLSCSYCLTGQSNFKSGHNDQRIFDPPQRGDCTPESDLGQRIRAVLDAIRSAHDPPVVKLTGGEVFLLRGIVDLIEEVAGSYESLIVQTNAALISEKVLDRLASIDNLVLQISLDAVDFEGNSYRVGSQEIHDRLMSRVERCLDTMPFVEIYTVINDRSIDHLMGLARYLSAWDRVRFFPFPVRGPTSAAFAPRPEQHVAISKLIEVWDGLRPVLPHRAYAGRLASFYEEGTRTFGCHVPRFVVSSFSDGVLTPCPNIWFSDMGNLIDDPEGASGAVGTTRFYDVLLQPRPRIVACKGCFTPWDTLSMLVNGEMAIEDITSDPPYHGPRSRRRLEEILETIAVERSTRVSVPVSRSAAREDA